MNDEVMATACKAARIGALRDVSTVGVMPQHYAERAGNLQGFKALSNGAAGACEYPHVRAVRVCNGLEAVMRAHACGMSS